MTAEFITMGVYGFNETGFFNILLALDVDTFCDIRLHRGMRGARYSFVNSTYLQKKLQDLGINYIHYKELAPSKEVRSKQKEADKNKQVQKRARQSLSQSFIQAYEDECLANFDSEAFVNSFGPEAKKVVLFCVEREPEACHRSLVAKKLVNDLGIQVEHIIP